MNNLLLLAAHNTVVALVLSLFVFGLTRVWRNPPAGHVLRLLVLLKLVAPPMMSVDWSLLQPPRSTPAHGQVAVDVPRIERQTAENDPLVVDRPAAQTQAQAPATTANDDDLAAGTRPFWNQIRPVLLWFWLDGAAVCALVAATRIVRFDRLLRDTLPASDRLQRLTAEMSARLGVRRVPDVRYLECALAPFVWCAGHRPTIVLPTPLSCQADDQNSALILAHELAHLRRRDHWVRSVELFVSIVYWWNPLVWVIRRQIHEAEDLCCDAWVRWAFPDCTKRYAELLLKTAESCQALQVGARPLLASPFLRSLSLKARIEMILESRFAPCISRRSVFVIGLLAFLVLPLCVQITTMEARAVVNDGAAAPSTGKPETPVTSELPYAVRVEQGATQFQDGDKITIVEIRGTADRFVTGNIYWIKGTYTLASHDRATLAAYTTAMDAENGRSTPLNVQMTVVNRGDGTFTLFLPMTCRGWPHVSFYPAQGGGDFGGNYFGTGDSVLKEWWGSHKTDRKATGTPAGSKDAAPATPHRNPHTPTASEFPHAVRFEQGATRFLNGDKITIVEVRGTADIFAPDNTYRIKGTYTLASHDQATLAAYISAMDADKGRSASLKDQRTVVNHGDGTFTLVLPMTYRGWPHVSFYPAKGGEGFGGNYFGTGDSVLKR